MTIRVVGAVLAGAAMLGLGACNQSGGEEAAAGADATAAADSSAAASATAAAPASDAGAAGGPTLRPGLWRNVVTDPTGGTSTNETCVRAGGDSKPVSGLEGATNCGNPATTREGGAWVTRATCSAGEGTPGGTVETRTTGDFQSRYTVDAVMRMTGGPEMKFRVESTRVGDC